MSQPSIAVAVDADVDTKIEAAFYAGTTLVTYIESVQAYFRAEYLNGQITAERYRTVMQPLDNVKINLGVLGLAITNHSGTWA